MKTKHFKLLKDMFAPGMEAKQGDIRTIGEWTSHCRHLIGHNIAEMNDWFEEVKEEELAPEPKFGTKPMYSEQDMIQFSQSAVAADRATRDVYQRMPVYLQYWKKKHKT